MDDIKQLNECIFWCDICKSHVGAKCISQHLIGKRHINKKRVINENEDYEKIYIPVPDMIKPFNKSVGYCYSCNCYVNYNEAQTHFNGKTHRRNRIAFKSGYYINILEIPGEILLQNRNHEEIKESEEMEEIKPNKKRRFEDMFNNLSIAPNNDLVGMIENLNI